MSALHGTCRDAPNASRDQTLSILFDPTALDTSAALKRFLADLRPLQRRAYYLGLSLVPRRHFSRRGGVA